MNADDDVRALLQLAASLGADFRESLPERRVPARATAEELRAAFGGPLPEAPTDAADVESSQYLQHPSLS